MERIGCSTTARFLALISFPPPPLLKRLRCRSSRTSYYLPSAGADRRGVRYVPVSSSPSPSCVLAVSPRGLYVSACQCSASESIPRGDDFPWPEWSMLLENLSTSGYNLFASPPVNDTEAEWQFVPDFPPELLHPALACLSLARDRPNLLSMLSKSDVETVVGNGFPLLFKSGEASANRLKLYLTGGNNVNNVLDVDEPNTVDLMKFLLSYVGNTALLDSCNQQNGERVKSSIRKLLGELAKLTSGEQDPNVYSSKQNQFSDDYGRTTPRPLGRNTEMKRGDWICTRCTFMNFSRNFNCLECDEKRPRRQLTGGEWECPQCDFYNYGKNTVCLRCDCKRPVPKDVSLNSVNSDASKSAEFQRRLAENELKAQRWFSKVSQLDSTSDMSSAITDEDFPEIMPLRKGVNRFVVSTRKTPLERRLADAQNRRNQTENENERPATETSKSLNELLGRPTKALGSSDELGSSEQNAVSGQTSPRTCSSDLFARKSADSTGERSETGISNTVENTRDVLVTADKSMNQIETANRASDDELPETMPIGNGENGLAVSRKKDRSLTSPANKRRLAIDQSQIPKFVPFVPFPPDYFAVKNDKLKPETPDSASKATGGASPLVTDERLDDSASLRQDSLTSSTSNIIKSSNGLSEIENTRQVTDSTQRTDDSSGKSIGHSGSESMGIRSTSWSEKSLERSAVKDPDPLDMSEEAKAERWFKRVAQVKDISELSQIPEEDFPSIMPMRKGVNRFVVSKRKTPLERKLMSQQHRRNLPTTRKESDS